MEIHENNLTEMVKVEISAEDYQKAKEEGLCIWAVMLDYTKYSDSTLYETLYRLEPKDWLKTVAENEEQDLSVVKAIYPNKKIGKAWLFAELNELEQLETGNYAVIKEGKIIDLFDEDLMSELYS